MSRLINTEKLPEHVKKLIEPYLEKLIEIHEDNIASILIYGSATGKGYVPKKSDINLMVLFKELNFETLKKSLKVVSDGIKRKITAPLFLTKAHIENSCDVFPVEYLEIQDNNIVLYGENIFSKIKIEDRNLRLVCEQQIKGKLIRLREAYLEIGLKKKGIEALLKESFRSMMPVFRNVLRLEGITPPAEKEQVLAELSDAFELDKEVFLAILKDNQNDDKIAGKDVEVYFEKFLEQIQKLAQVIDKYRLV